jgi:putative hydrolases of HD superfamily
MPASEGEQIIDFLHQAEKLKTILRHSWLSSGRRESVAEHSWRMALMAILISPYLDKPIDLLKTLKLTIVHDLVEINYKDNPAFKTQPADKSIQERKSLIKLLKPLPTKLKNELLELWEEYEAGKTTEAKFAKALDKTEVLLQHTEAEIKHLTKKEYSFNFYHGLEHTKHDKFLKEFRHLINLDTLKNYQRNKVNKELYKDWIN